MLRQVSFFGVDPDPEHDYSLFHDERGTYTAASGDRWLFHGVLIIPNEQITDAVNTLQDVRRATGFTGEVHFVKLRSSTMGPKASCAAGWLDAFVRAFPRRSSFHCLAVDTKSPTFDARRFSQPHQAYNRFACMAVVGGIAWSLSSDSRAAIALHSHARSRDAGDNFEAYLPAAVVRRIAVNSARGVHYPRMRLIRNDVSLIPSDPSETPLELSSQGQLIQLADLLTSSVAQALDNTSTQRAKLMLADVVSEWILDARKAPWLQALDLHRRFSLSCFPGPKGRFYNPLLDAPHRNQQSLPFDNTDAA